MIVGMTIEELLSCVCVKLNVSLIISLVCILFVRCKFVVGVIFSIGCFGGGIGNITVDEFFISVYCIGGCTGGGGGVG